MQCEMCGKEAQLYNAEIEGSILSVCKSCGGFGKLIGPIKKQEQQKLQSTKESKKEKPALGSLKQDKEIIQVIVEDYSTRIKQKREQLGLKQEELAKMLAEKESLIQKMEAGQFEPSIALARKIEKTLKITLVEQHEETHDKKFSARKEQLTVGDLLQMQ
ncbi:MAG: multiprotein bridging factor aMBF1 [Candidatus Woesearchaeota archaeon]